VDWQVQEAKQRFSELLRRVHEEGPQKITRHGEEVAVVVDVAWFREKVDPQVDLITWLTRHDPHETFADEMDRIVAERGSDHLGRDVDLFEDLVTGHGQSPE
jgi:prevent-host-death family protein